MVEVNFSEYKELINKAFVAYLRRPGLLGIDVGFHFVDQLPTENIGVRVHFLNASETDMTRLLPDEAIQLLFFKTEGIEKRIVPKLRWRKRHPLLRPGISIGCASTGTLGLIGVDRRGGRPAILTCRHLFGRYRPGRETYLMQPGPGEDKGIWRRDTIGFLKHSIRGLDAALVQLTSKRRRTKEVLFDEGGKPVITSLRPVKLGDILAKSGRTTAVTRGRVDGIGRYFTGARNPGIGMDGFRLISLDPAASADDEISFSGDSGAVWFDESTGEGVGLNFAGDPKNAMHYAEFALALHLELTCHRLGFVLK